MYLFAGAGIKNLRPAVDDGSGGEMEVVSGGGDFPGRFEAEGDVGGVADFEFIVFVECAVPLIIPDFEKVVAGVGVGVENDAFGKPFPVFDKIAVVLCDRRVGDIDGEDGVAAVGLLRIGDVVVEDEIGGFFVCYGVLARKLGGGVQGIGGGLKSALAGNAGDHGQRDGRQDADDQYNDQQFSEREGAF